MSYTRETTLWCDNNMCNNWDTFPTGKVSLANIDAKEPGWKIKGKVHLCAKCAGGYDIKNGEIVDIPWEGKR